MKHFFYVLIILFLSQHSGLKAQQWANTERFKAENELLKASNTPISVVFMGNSITEGWLESDPHFFKTPGFVNRGISGQTTPQMLLRTKQDILDLHPKAVVILAGTNDIAGNTGPTTVSEIFGHIQSMAALAADANINVILCSVLPVFDYPWKPGLTPAPKIINLNNKLKVLAISKGYAYVDYHGAMANSVNGLKKHLGADGVHPNKAGYAIMKPLLMKAINNALEE